MKTTTAFSFVIMCLVWMPYVRSASFDCAKAKTKIEKQICSNTKLSELDDKLTALYNKVLAQSPVPEDTKEQQREWVKGSRNVCKDAACLERAYASRISDLKKNRWNEPVVLPLATTEREVDTTLFRLRDTTQFATYGI